MNLTHDWNVTATALHEKGFALLPQVLSVDECTHLASMFDQGHHFRSTIDMKRYRFGSGTYKYFNYPLPGIIQALRTHFYNALVPVANSWMSVLQTAQHFPPTHKEFIDQCHAKKQVRPTPLLLRYEKGGYNTLHQDLYGEIYFPFQVVFILTQRGHDHLGGELVLTEQVPRAQSKAHVINPEQGDALIFTTNFKPVKGTRGYYRAAMKHGVAEVTEGLRYALGIIFHDAQ